jgi:nitrate/TMAO reductase-like tetraheme cytochrome c subunit
MVSNKNKSLNSAWKFKLFMFSIKKIYWVFLFIGFFLGIGVFLLSNKAIVSTSSNEFCMSCHIHPHAEESWKLSTH